MAETGTAFNSPDPSALADMVRKHMEANGVVPRPDFGAWFEDELCSQSGLGEPWCGPPRGGGKPNRPGVTMEKVARFINTIRYLAKDGFRAVPMEEAERRARTCATCPLNQNFSACPKCRAIFALAKRMIRKRRTAVNDSLHVCAACGCFLQLKVLVPNEVLDAAESGKRPAYHARCWRNR